MAATYRDALETLEGARKLIRNPKRWVKNKYAVDKNGSPVKPTNKRAVAFCALGAVQHVDGPGEDLAIEILESAAREELISLGEIEDDLNNQEPDEEMIFSVNDEFGRYYVLSMFRRAIKIAKSKKRGKKST